MNRGARPRERDEIAREILDRCVPIVGRLGQAAEEHRVERARDALLHGARALGLVLQDGATELAERFAAKRKPAGDQLMERHAE